MIANLLYSLLITSYWYRFGVYVAATSIYLLDEEQGLLLLDWLL